MNSLIFVILLFCASAYACAKDKASATISYTLWIDNGIDEVHNVNVTAPVNTTFYNVMKIAARDHPDYMFQAKEYDFGHYITEIGGHHEDKENSVYWLIYQTQKIPNRDHPPTDDLLTDAISPAMVSYTLWINNEIDESRTIYVFGPENITFYTVMLIAASEDPNYVFRSMYCDWGHYINEIGGRQADKGKGVYWFLYKTPNIPDTNNPPSDDFLIKGVNDVRIKNGEHYVFWYKKIETNDPNKEFCELN